MNWFIALVVRLASGCATWKSAPLEPATIHNI